MDFISSENIMILLLAAFSAMNLFANYINKPNPEQQEYARVLSQRARE